MTGVMIGLVDTGVRRLATLGAPNEAVTGLLMTSVTVSRQFMPNTSEDRRSARSRLCLSCSDLWLQL